MTTDNNIKTKKIAVVHDHLSWPGGGERTALIMAEELGADFITAYAIDGVYADYRERLGKRFIVLSGGIIDLRIIRFFHTRLIFWLARKRLKSYDTLIASGQPATEAVAFYSRKDARKIVYTHTPPRRIYDMREFSRKTYPFFLRPLFDIFVWMWRRSYEYAVRQFDVNIANSQNIANRLLRYADLKADAIVWPPIATDKFQWIKQGDYFLSWGRVDEAKRIDVIVEAFKKMPQQKLIVASSGPCFERVQKLAEGCANIEMLGYVPDEKLRELVGSCRAAIYIPMDEDAGMTQLEANAAGKPVLGVAEGGLLETIEDGETGILIRSNPDKDNVSEAVQKMSAEWCLARRIQCEEQAQKYGKEVFVKRIKELL
ncbi:glycosyltransferase [Candidatus Parcubacteria bacterium]|nr:glycosyltransferase [Patescibacteria group bacterium]MBU4309394.1 glycosyltransferase [Patescibacteria group bacterium]MBU4431751.1 glycosyltransferase [Patescibacteria group bacterium]MBU4577755.1 glycosyltransferase [Patescibacteria group bacterium]MCG2697440.1 glycosyltransferase [Candidatus Parcubacteria bacterium]